MSKIKLPKNSLNFNKDFYSPYMKNMRKEVEATGLKWAEQIKKIIEPVHEEIKRKLPNSFYSEIKIDKPSFFGYQSKEGLMFYGSVNLIYGPPSNRADITIDTEGEVSIEFMNGIQTKKIVMFKPRNSETLKKRILKELRNYLR